IVRRQFAGHATAGELKGVGDYVTAVDRESEEAIRSFLRRQTPHIHVLAEESGGERGDRFWAVDPLDGTTNLLLGFPVVAVSVALIEGDRPVVGAVQGPLLGLSFSSARGQGAWSGSQRIQGEPAFTRARRDRDGLSIPGKATRSQIHGRVGRSSRSDG